MVLRNLMPRNTVLLWHLTEPKATDWLSSQERQRYTAFMDTAARREYLIAATGLRHAAGEVLGTAPGDVRVDRTCERCGAPHGRPAIEGLCVSVAHAGGVALVALSDGPVGVDLEPIGREVPPDCGATDLTDWVRKEAVLKLSGHGLRVPMADVVIEAGEVTSWPAEPLPALRVHDLVLTGFAVAVAANADASITAHWARPGGATGEPGDANWPE